MKKSDLMMRKQEKANADAESILKEMESYKQEIEERKKEMLMRRHQEYEERRQREKEKLNEIIQLSGTPRNDKYLYQKMEDEFENEKKKYQQDLDELLEKKKKEMSICVSERIAQHQEEMETRVIDKCDCFRVWTSTINHVHHLNQ